MKDELCIAVFGSVLRARASIQAIINQYPSFAGNLTNLTIFLRTGPDTVETGVLSLQANGKVINIPKGQLDLIVLRQFLPKNADWHVVYSINSDRFPTAKLNKEFDSYLNLMLHTQTCSVFFVPQNETQTDRFQLETSKHAKVVIRTTLQAKDLKTLRASLSKSREAQ